MSKDVKLTRLCPHLTLGERVILADDRRSLPVLQPIASASSIRVTINDEFVVPPGGLYSSAILTSSRSGPFRIESKLADLTIQTGDTTQTTTLPTGPRVETAAIVRVINQVGGLNFLAGSDNGHLEIAETRRMGTNSFVKVSGGALPALGLDFQTRARGRLVYPGWSLVTRTDTTVESYFPKFTSPLKQNPVVKVSYATFQGSCKRCATSGVENDWQYDSFGDVIFVQNEDLLVQAALKIIITGRGTNPYHPWYGSTVKSRIGTKILGAVADSISQDIRRSLEAMQRAQRAQARAQQVSFKERLYTIEAVQVSPHVKDPTTFLVEVFARNASRQPVEISTVFASGNVASFLNDVDPFEQARLRG